MSRSQSSHSIPPLSETAIPTLRVMRLQSPEIHHSNTSSSSLWGNQCALQTALCLPDSLTVYVGEYFTAYLGVLNASKNVPIRRLTVSAQLQTPSQRFQLPSVLDKGNLSGGMDVEAESSVDAIVSRVIEEPGQHILRVEVGYSTADGGSKTFRKFYRFPVLAPLLITESTTRMGDTRCLVSISVKYPRTEKEKQYPIMIASSSLETATGLTATNVGCTSSFPKTSLGQTPTAVELFDAAGSMIPGGSFRYIFSVEAASKEAIVRGIASGDYLGRAVFSWRKAMGETGTVYSAAIHCPRAEPAFDTVGPGQRMTCSDFVVHRSGLSVDVAAASASAPAKTSTTWFSDQLLVTVEPIDPPTRMKLNIAAPVQLLVVNHSDYPLTLQLQFALSHMDHGLVICGPCFKNLGEIKANGGSTVTLMHFLPLKAGLMRVEGCAVVDLASGREMVQPPLFHVFVDCPTIPALTEEPSDDLETIAVA